VISAVTYSETRLCEVLTACRDRPFRTGPWTWGETDNLNGPDTSTVRTFSYRLHAWQVGCLLERWI
jgi:hypothetical protein